MKSLENVQNYYDETVEDEWIRLDKHYVEYELTKRYLKRYINPSDKILDLGGGPGKYALHLSEFGCDVTLADLSPKNIAFGLNKAKELNLPLEGMCVDSRDLSCIDDGLFDHVICMGPMYHLTNEKDRIQTITECMRVLKPGGTLFVAFVSSYSFVWDYLIQNPEYILEEEKKKQLEVMLKDVNFAGKGFSDNFFMKPKEILPFIQQFSLEKLTIVNCESFLYLQETELLKQAPEVVSAWLDLAEQVCEREDLLSLAEHIMYIGRKLD